MEYIKKNCSSRRPLVIISIVFIVVVVTVGAVVWKVTKDAYESDHKAEQNVKSKDTGGKDSEKIKNKPALTEEELRQSPWKRLLLPRNVLPVHYDITLYPDFYGNGSVFYGNETIELNITSPTRFLLIHVHTYFMNVTNARVMDNETESDISIKRHFIYKPNEFFVIETEVEMSKAVRVMLQFEGSLIKSIMGFYKTTYMDTKTKETKYLAASKFEPTYARRAFPCLDEPNLKAEYTVTLLHTPDFFALSNMPVDGNPASVQWSNELVSTKFQRSVKMSTYLVCFIVCDFKSISTTSSSGVPIKVYATTDKIDQANYALEMAKHSLDKYEKVFKIPYPLPKQDLIALPEFVSGAMEHWGLMSFRESVLLFDPVKSPLSSKERVSAVVCHEMAHQWFGNIVTMDWWNDLWLNEGFASYMEYLCVAAKETTWDYNSIFLVKDTLRVMPFDAWTSSHPIVVAVENPDEITSVFDLISYSKGSAVINMLEKIMGTDNFFAGISDYLKKYAWANAKTDDLWESLTKINPAFDVKKIMDTWTLQDGYPFVNISLIPSPDGQTTVKAVQKRFMSDSKASINVDASPFKYKWYISLDYTTTKGGNGVKIMDMVDDIEFTEDFALSSSPTNWLKFNKNKNGYYKVLYPDDMWLRFAEYLTSTSPDSWTLDAGDRADLLFDAFTFAGNQLSYDSALTLASYLSEETQYVPWSAVVHHGFSYISGMLKETSDYVLWKKFLLELVKPVIDRLGFEDKGSHIERRLRSLILNQGCFYGESSTLTEVEKMFRNWLDNGTSPSVNFRSTVYSCGMAQFGTDDDWRKIWQKYLRESSPQEKGLLIYALSQTKKPYFMAELLDRARRVDGIKTQDFFTVVGNVGTNIYGNSIVWDWARENYKEFEQRFTVNDRSFGRMISGMVGSYNTDVKLNEVKAFFLEHPNEGASARYRKIAIENIEKNINWMETSKKDVVKWLNRKYPSV